MSRSVEIILAIAFGTGVASRAAAAEIVLFTAGAVKKLVSRIEGLFTQATGHRIKATFDTVGAQRERVEKGERPDVVILSSASVAQLSKLGLIDDTSIRDVGDVEVGLVIAASGNAQGKSAPDISTPEALRATLLAAKSIAYADPARGATAGAHFAKVLTTLGINDTMANRTSVLVFGVEVIEAVAAGKFELGVSQSSEIVQHKGVRCLGALPPPYRLGTRYQVAALKAKPAAASLIEFFCRSALRVTLCGRAVLQRLNSARF